MLDKKKQYKRDERHHRRQAKAEIFKIKFIIIHYH